MASSVVDELLDTGTIGKVVKRQQEQATSVVDDLIFGEQGISPRSQFRDDYLQFERKASQAASPIAALRAGTATDKQFAIKEFARMRGIPESRYRVVNDEIVYQADDGKFYAEIPGMMTSPLSSIGYVAPDVLEAVPDVAAGILTSPMMLTGPGGVAASTALTGGVSGVSSLLRQKAAQSLTGQPIDVSKPIVSGGISAATQVIPFGAGKFVERRLASDIKRVDPNEVKRITEEAKRQGISLTPAEITNLASLKTQQKVLGKVPESSDIMSDFYRDRYIKQVQPAVDSFLSQISKVDDPATAGFRGQQALQTQLDSLITKRDELAEPFYKEAFERSVPVDVSPIIKQIDTRLNVAKGAEASYLKRIKEMLFRDMPTLNEAGETVTRRAPENRLPALQSAKFNIDAMFKEDTLNSLDATIKGNLSKIQANLLDAMGKDNPAYLEANKVFADASKPINEFMERRTGVSLVNISRDNLNQFASRIFEGASPDSIKYAKKQITAADPSAWDALSRSWLQQNWEKAMKPTANATELKIDAGLSWKNILLGDVKSAKALQVALDPKQYQALVDLADVLQAAGRVNKLGSDTAFNAKVLEDMKSSAPGAFTALLRFAGNINLAQPLQAIGEFAEKRSFGKNAETLATIITSPDGISKLRELKKMSPTSVKWWSGMSQLLTNYLDSGSELNEEQ
jgi:hypothetical protein